MSAIAALSRARRMAATAESLLLYVPDTASTFPVWEISLNSKAPWRGSTSSNIPDKALHPPGVGVGPVRDLMSSGARTGWVPGPGSPWAYCLLVSASDSVWSFGGVLGVGADLGIFPGGVPFSRCLTVYPDVLWCHL
jgi:hypothetical protein